MDKHLFKQLLIYNKTCKDIDEYYHRHAKMHNISDSAFWILYSLAENGRTSTQKELCDWWSVSKQTINSALKNMEKEGIVELSGTEENKKIKTITLTDKGIDMVKTIVLPVMEAEQDAFTLFGKKETDEYLRLHSEYKKCLGKEFEKIDR